MKTGFVQMPLERYDELLVLKQAIKSSFRLEDDYKDEPALKFEFKNFLNIIEDLLAESKYAGKYKVRDADSLYAGTIYNVFERISEE